MELKRLYKKLLNLLQETYQIPGEQNQGTILDEYVRSRPSPQHALDIFEGEWSSKFPEPYTDVAAGSIGLFEDERIEWANQMLGGVKDKNVLELGPLEAGHTYMIEKFGAASITSIEANTRAYLKCLIVKELLCLRNARFLCGDFIGYLLDVKTKYDICIASGVLYHMRNPVQLLELIARSTNHLFLWTHYYDHEIISKKPGIAERFTGNEVAEHAEFLHTLYRQEYNIPSDLKGFCGGGEYYSNWLARDDILNALRHFGFKKINIGFDEPDHPNGPSFAVVAIHKPATQEC